MRFQILTLFPEMIEQALRFGVVGQAAKLGRITVTTRSPREFTENVHQTIDDRPFGGGDGMIMMAEPTARALKAMVSEERKRRVIHLSPRGRVLNDSIVRDLLAFDEIVLISSRYGGIDERLLERHVDDELSIGDYVLSGGELAALVVVDSIARLIPGVLGNQESSERESFRDDRLEHPQYTRPREWEGSSVPETLLSGDHQKIERWKTVVSLLVTLERRPDLKPSVSEQERRRAQDFLRELSTGDARRLGLRDPDLVRERLEQIQTVGDK